MEKQTVFLNKCSTLAEAVKCPRGPRVEIDGRNIVGIFLRGITVVTKEYAEVKLVSMQPDPQGRYWSFSCPLAYASMLPADDEHYVYGSWTVSSPGYLLYQGQVETGSASALAKATLTENPDWFLQNFVSVQSQLKEFAAKQEY